MSNLTINILNKTTYDISKEFNPYIEYDPNNAPVIFNRDANLIQNGSKIKIVTLPVEGELQLVSSEGAVTEVSIGTEITVADLDANKLRYKNKETQNDYSDHFSYSVLNDTNETLGNSVTVNMNMIKVGVPDVPKWRVLEQYDAYGCGENGYVKLEIQPGTYQVKFMLMGSVANSTANFMFLTGDATINGEGDLPMHQLQIPLNNDPNIELAQETDLTIVVNTVSTAILQVQGGDSIFAGTPPRWQLLTCHPIDDGSSTLVYANGNLDIQGELLEPFAAFVSYDSYYKTNDPYNPS